MALPLKLIFTGTADRTSVLHWIIVILFMIPAFTPHYYAKLSKYKNIRGPRESYNPRSPSSIPRAMEIAKAFLRIKAPFFLPTAGCVRQPDYSNLLWKPATPCRNRQSRPLPLRKGHHIHPREIRYFELMPSSNFFPFLFSDRGGCPPTVFNPSF
jgi:hypothetical protein